MVGNAVPVIFAYHLAKKIKETFSYGVRRMFNEKDLENLRKQ